MVKIFLAKNNVLFLLAICVQLICLPAQGQLQFDWTVQMGGKLLDEGTSIVTDPDRNVIVVGNFNETADFGSGVGGGTLVSKGSTDVFIAKRDASGRFLWARSIGADKGDRGVSVATDNSGNVYVAGYFEGTVDFDPDQSGSHLVTAIGGADFFVLKLDADGKFVWAKTMGGDAWDQGITSIAVDDSGNVYTTGFFVYTVNFNPDRNNPHELTPKGVRDVFISKLDASGNFVWVKQVDGDKNIYSNSVTVDREGNIYATGSFNGLANFHMKSGIITLSAFGGSGVFALKMDAAGNAIWAKQLGGNTAQDGTEVRVDVAGNVYLTGWFYNIVDFNPGKDTFNLESKGNNDVYIVKLDANGDFIWAKSIGGPYNDIGSSIALDRLGNVYTIGYFNGVTPVDFDPDEGGRFLPFLGSVDVFISVLDPSGKYKWAVAFGGTGFDYGNDITIDGSGNVFATGYFQKEVEFNPGQASSKFTSFGDEDVFVYKLVCADTSSSLVRIVLCEDTYVFNNVEYNSTGIYSQQYPNSAGCDSTVQLDVTLNGKLTEPDIVVDGLVLRTMEIYDKYQWLLNDTIIPGATGREYTVKENGDYKVIVENEKGCSDTSDSYIINNVPGNTIGPVTGNSNAVTIFPNPVKDILYLSTGEKWNLIVRSIDGRVVRRVRNTNNIDVSILPQGLYIMQALTFDGAVVFTGKFSRQD